MSIISSKIQIVDRNNENARAIVGTVFEEDRNTLRIQTDTLTMQHALTILDEAEAVESLVLKSLIKVILGVCLGHYRCDLFKNVA